MSNPALDSKPTRTAMMPVTTMEEVPVLDEAARGEFLATLKAAEADVAAGRAVAHDPATFVERLWAMRGGAKKPDAV